ncbi:MAG: hypothetical protein WAW37_05200 [Syntrophobacteraceae bacterium]
MSFKALFLAPIFVVLFALYIWPTPYRYAQVTTRNKILQIRINRLTDETYVRTVKGWKPVPKDRGDKLAEFAVPVAP